MRRWLSVIVLALTVVGPAAAADAGPNDPALVVTTTDRPEAPLEPGGEEQAWDLNVTYHSVAPTPEEVTVRLEAGDLGLYDARVEPAEITFRPALHVDDPRDRSVTLDADLYVAADEHAPAYVVQQLEVEATAEATTIQGQGEGTAKVTLVPAYRPDLDVEAEQRELTVPGDEAIRVPVELHNGANGETRVGYGPIEAPDGCQVRLLDEAYVLARNETGEAAFDLACEAGSEGGELAVTYEHAYARDHRKAGPPVTQTWDVEVDRAPGSGVQAALLGTGASAGGLPVAVWVGLATAGLAAAYRVADP